MVKPHHEAMHQVYRRRPEVVSAVLRALNVPVPPDATVEVMPTDCTELEVLERRLDSVLKMTLPDKTEFMLAVEAQNAVDEDKETSWPYYVGYLTEKYKRPTLLMVTCQDERTAGWARGPHSITSAGWTSQVTFPLVVSPDSLPGITDVKEAEANLPLAFAAAVIHGKSPDVSAILDTLARALASVDRTTAMEYADLVECGLRAESARKLWRELMPFQPVFPDGDTLIAETFREGVAEGQAQGEAKGEAKGEANSVLRVLGTRGVPGIDEVEARVRECTDHDELRRWLDRALSVGHAREIFDAGD